MRDFPPAVVLAATRSAALVVALLGGGCATGGPDDASTRFAETLPLSVSLARLRSPSASDTGLPTIDARPGTANRSSDARSAREGSPVRPPPRALDPIPPLYVPPSRALALQPILDVPLATPPGPRSRPSRAHRSGPPDVIDPLRRIDPVNGRDPLGRPDPSGGVDLVGTLAR